MLIKIDDTIIQYLEKNYQSLDSQSQEIKSLNNIAKAFYEGYHTISASLEVLEFLTKLDILEYTSKYVYSHLLSKFTFLPAYESFCTDYILVKGSDLNFSRIETDNNCIFEVPLKYFTGFMAAGPTTLISEDISDCIFYEKLARKYIEENRQRININLCFDHTPGNGDGTYRIYKHKIEANRITLAIADSDKTYPEDNIGETLLKLKNTYNDYKDNTVTSLIGLNVREKENLISPSLYLMCTNSGSKASLEKLLKVETSSELNIFLKYMDLKDGIKAKSLKGNENRRKYFEDLFKEFSDLTACSYEEIDDQEDDFSIISGIGRSFENFLNDVLDEGLEKKLDEKRKVAEELNIPEEIIVNLEKIIAMKNNLFEYVPEYLKEEWENLCQKIVSWGCCPGPLA
ncbi:hypothetical protein [Priestia megaterium]|uniref:hypothetical protein n=1 Tax=Priestia megaterium TaxID=1404 RepID=UPI0031FCA15A